MCFSCPMFLVKENISFSQCEHFNQVEPFEKSLYFVMNILIIMLNWDYKKEVKSLKQQPFFTMDNECLQSIILCHCL
jgi:hypothetical protein